MSTTSITKEFGISKTGKTVVTIAGFVALELLLVYGLIPVGIFLWRMLVCPEC
jgi:hypothetical protein